MDFEWTLNKFQYPLDKISLNVSIDKILFDWTFLQYSKAKSLGNVSIFLLFQYFNYFFDYNVAAIVGDVLDTFYCWDNHRYQWSYCVLQRITFDGKETEYKFEIIFLLLGYFENVSAD